MRQFAELSAMRLRVYLSTQIRSPTSSGLLVLATLSFAATTLGIFSWSWVSSPQPSWPRMHICGCIQHLWFGSIPWLLDGGDLESFKPLFYRYSRIVGHCNRDSAHWLRRLGAEVRPGPGGLTFKLEARHVVSN